MSNVGRNDPCPCGSGKKYKKCCFGDYDIGMGAPIGKTPFVAPSDVNSEYEPYLIEGRDTDACGKRVTETHDWAALERDEENALPVFPDPPKVTLPALPPDQDRLIDDWWKVVKTLYKKPDADAMLRHLTGFWDLHPALVPYLELEMEFLFELGAELGRRKEWPRYADVLVRLRDEHPVAYSRSFGYFDHSLIAEALVQGRAGEAPRFFDFFRRYPGSDGDNGDRIARLLAWAGAEEALLEFVKPIRQTPHARGVSLDADWLLFALQIPHLDTGADPDEAADSVEKELNRIDLAHPSRWVHARLRQAFDQARQAPSLPDYDQCRTRAKVASFLDDVLWNFTGFLHRSKGLPWTRAFFLADRLRHYWSRRAEDDRPKTPFCIDIKKFETFLCRTCRTFFHNDGVLSASGIEAMGHFADYLLACGVLGEQERLHLRDGCRTMYRRALPTYDSTDPVPRLMPDLLLEDIR
jgi:hypothetical protein